MDLKLQLALMSMRARRYFQRTGKKITINESDTAGYDRQRPRNQDSLRKTMNVEDTSSKAMVAIDGAGFDWSYMADDEVPTNMALMPFSGSKLAILGENISQEDLNMKFLRSLPSEWNTHVVVERNKADLDTMRIDDLYKNFKIIEQEVKRTRTGKKITINESDTAGYDRQRPKNQDNLRKTMNVEDTSSKAMVAIDEAGFDWSYMADDEVPTNMALMPFSDLK
nr:ribonuclease H-like domain-containing protein [Tanacetum cinerariifolium]